MVEAKSTVHFDGKEWFPFVTRNMSFWHQCLSSQGIYRHLVDFGVKTNVHQLAITAGGTHTVIFVYEPKHRKDSEAIKRAWLEDGGPERFERFYKQFSESLLQSLRVAKESLTTQTWQAFQFEYSRFCGALQCTAVFGRVGLEALEERLRVLGIKGQQVPEIISTVTYPETHTPLFSSQLDLYGIAARHLPPAGEEDELNLWLQKYAHIPVNFCDEPWNLQDAKEQLAVVKIKDVAKELEKLSAGHNEKILLVRKTLSEINDGEVTLLSNALAKATYLNEFRKGIFSRVSLEYRPVFKRIASVGGSDNWRDCFFLTPDEMISLVSGKSLPIKDVVFSREFTGLYVTDDSGYRLLSEDVVKKFSSFIESLHGRENNTGGAVVASEVRGFPASKGIARGKAKIILSSRDFHKLVDEDVLVTTMTSVDFIPVMERAVAFVTNEGGITSHAAIVAREMGKPCIIGTKIATQVLKDGDMVEVNANEGIVKIVKRSG